MSRSGVATIGGAKLLHHRHPVWHRPAHRNDTIDSGTIAMNWKAKATALTQLLGFAKPGGWGGENGVLAKIFELVAVRAKFAVEFGQRTIGAGTFAKLIEQRGWGALYMDREAPAPTVVKPVAAASSISLARGVGLAVELQCAAGQVRRTRRLGLPGDRHRRNRLLGLATSRNNSLCTWVRVLSLIVGFRWDLIRYGGLEMSVADFSQKDLSMTSEPLSLIVLGNCQAGPLRNIIQRVMPAAVARAIKAVHLLKPGDLSEVDRQIELADVIVHQPIGVSFGAFSLGSIKSRFPCKRYLSFPSLYFSGYFPHLMYLRKPGGGTLPGVVGDYHDSRIVEAYLKGGFVPIVESDLASAPQDGDPIASALISLRSREADLDIKVGDYLAEQVRRKRLFYVMNHPANAVLVEVARQLSQLLCIPFAADAAVEVAGRESYLSNYMVPVELPVLDYLHATFDCKRRWAVKNPGINLDLDFSEYIRASYAMYETVPDMAALFKFAVQRQVQMEKAAHI